MALDECDTTLACVAGRPQNYGTCRDYCDTYVVEDCCFEADADNPNCPKPYPFTRSYSLSSGPWISWNGDEDDQIDLAKPSCGPVVMNFSSTVKAINSTDITESLVEASIQFSGAEGGYLIGEDVSQIGNYAYPMFVQVDREKARLDPRFSAKTCTLDSCGMESMTARFSFSEFVPDVASSSGVAPEEPRVAGDNDGVLVSYRDVVDGKGQAMLTGGQLAAVSGQYFLGEPQYVSAFSPFRLSSVDADAQRPALVHRRDIDDQAGDTYVVWIEDDSSLQYASVTDAGATVTQGEIHSGLDLSAADIAEIAASTYLVTFLERVDTTVRLRGLLLDESGTEVLGVTDIVSRSTDVVSPSVAAPRDEGENPIVAWIDADSGSDKVYAQLVDAATLSLVDAPENVAPSAVSPSHPTVRVSFSSLYTVVYSDVRNGKSRIYSVDQANGEQMVTDEDAVAPSFPKIRPVPPSERPTMHWTHALAWTATSETDTVRFGYDSLQSSDHGKVGEGISFGCDGATTRDLSISEIDVYPRFAGGANGTWVKRAPRLVGTWIDDGKVVVKQLVEQATRSTARCTPGAHFCSDAREIMLCDADGRSATHVDYCHNPFHCVEGESTCGGTLGPSSYSEDFEDTDLSDWLHGKGAHKMELSTEQAHGGATSLRLERKEPSSHLAMTLRQFESMHPTTVSLWVYPQASFNLVFESEEGYLMDVGYSSGEFYGYKGLTKHTVDAPGYQWHHIEWSDIDWSNKTAVLKINGEVMMYEKLFGNSLRSVDVRAQRGVTFWDDIVIE